MTSSGKRDLLMNVATLYYLGNQSQEEIARKLGFSRSKISRLLTQCKDMKIVEFHINSSPLHLKNLAERIEKQFGLRKVVVTPSGQTAHDSIQSAAKSAAEYLESIVKDNMIIGVAWGSTIYSMILQFNTSKMHNNTSLIQLSGGIHSSSPDLDAQGMVKALAEKLRAKWELLQVPLMVQSRLLRDMLLKEPEVKRHFDLFKKMDIAIVGLGSSRPEEVSAYRTGHITLEEAQDIMEKGLAADVCGNRLSMDGQIMDHFIQERIICASVHDLKRTPIVIAIGAGEKKVSSTLAGIRGHIVNTLFLDELAAIGVLSATESTRVDRNTFETS